MSYNTEVAADSPIAWLKLNESAPSGAGSVLDYSTGGTYDGTPAGAITWSQVGPITDGTSNSGLFDGATGKVTIGSTITADLMLAANWTIELWYYPGISNAGTMFAAAADSTHRVAIQHFGGQLFTSSTVGGNKSSGALGTGQTVWHHVALRSDGTLYVDGVLRSGTAGSTLSSTVAATIGCRNSSTDFFNGRISNVALYTTQLSEARILAHHAAGVISQITDGRTFYWDFETNTPNVFPVGSDDTPFYDQSAALSSAQAYAGSQSLSVGGGTFRSCTFNNQTNQDRWARKTEGKVVCRMRYNGTATDFMIFQITGKDRSLIDDKNDAVVCRFTPTTVTFSHISENGANTKSVVATVSLAADTWHLIEARWRTASSPNLTLVINGTEYNATQTLGTMTVAALRHLLIGNDRNATPTGMWIDEFEVFGAYSVAASSNSGRNLLLGVG